MAIKDLEVRQGSVDIVIEVVEKGEVREFQKFGKTGRVCNAKIKDETGEMNLTLWNEQIDQVNVGDKVHIINGYVNEFQGEKQLTTGKFGKLEVVGKGEGSEEGKEVPPSTEESAAEETAEEPSVEEESIEEEKVE
jgi:replication factor A1